ncbi:MAG: pyridoxal phosphate-dependent aminotransferase [Candidatus Berkelbacteria bacterium]|nr:pyridoxal phosphate-dependent aminotransferase [Candidatus Berkelbacteria bacterium]
MKLSKTINRIILPNLEGYFKSQSNDLINLTIGEPDFDVHKKVKQKLLNCSNSRFKYSSSKGNTILREQIADHINNQNKTQYTKDNILITTGSSYSLFLAYQTLFDRDDEIIIFEPYFPPYIELAKIVGAKPKVIPTFPTFIPELSQISKKISTKTKAILLNSPSNPTGRIYTKEFLLEVVKLAKKHDLFIISDEVYKDFDYDNKFLSPAEFYYKTIVVNSFSKSHAATGLRIGYLCGPVEVIEAANKLLFLEQVCVADFIQELFVDNLDISQKASKIYKKNRDMVIKELGGNFKFVIPDGGFYFFIKCPSEEKIFVAELAKKGVLVMPGSIFSSRKDYFRISLISDKIKLKKALEIIKSVL